MATNELTLQHAWWAEILCCFEFEIKFQLARQSNVPDPLYQPPNIALSREEKLIIDQLLGPKNIYIKMFA